VKTKVFEFTDVVTVSLKEDSAGDRMICTMERRAPSPGHKSHRDEAVRNNHLVTVLDLTGCGKKPRGLPPVKERRFSAA
jgi:hypothetical protein